MINSHLKKNGAVLVFILFALLISCSSNRNRHNTLTFVSVEEELALGQELAGQTLKTLRIIRNQTVNDFFNTLCRKLGSVSDWDGLDYRLFIVNEPDLNHFSLPGGNIFIFRGLIEEADNASQIAGVIAHEIAHIANRDGVDGVSRKYAFAFAAQSILGNNPEIAHQIVKNLYSETTILDYPEERELLADKDAVRYLWKANLDPRGYDELITTIIEFFVVKSERISLLSLTHPSPTKRQRLVRSEIKHMPQKSNLVQDFETFQDIKTQLARIPK